MSHVFILGAGFSRAISDDMPLLGDLSEVVWRDVIERGELHSELLRFPEFKSNVELLLDYLGQRQPWQSERRGLLGRVAFLEVQQRIAHVVNDAEGPAFLDGSPKWLLDMVRWCEEHRSHIITLNYDTCVERALAEMLSSFDIAGLYGVPLQNVLPTATYGRPPSPRVSLHKLHGSLNWYYSGRNEFSAEQLYYLWPYTVPQDDLSRIGLIPTVDKVPFIVPPISDKSAFYGHQTLQAVWRLAGAALGRCRRLFCLGYSIPQTDMTLRHFLGVNRPREQAEVLIVNRPPSEQEGHDLLARYREALPEESYRIDDRLVLTAPEQPVPAFVEWLTECPSE